MFLRVTYWRENKDNRKSNSVASSLKLKKTLASGDKNPPFIKYFPFGISTREHFILYIFCIFSML